MNTNKNIKLMYAVALLQGMVFYAPIATLYRQQRGIGIFQIGLIESISLIVMISLELPWGYIADKIGYKKIFYLSYTLTAPCILLLLSLHGHWVFIGAFLVGFFNMSTMPLAVVWAQRLAPKGKSMVSSLMMGLAVGTGGMMAPITGSLAEVYSIRTVLTIMAAVSIATLILVYLMPEKKRGGVSF